MTTKTVDDLKGEDYIDSRDIIEVAQELCDETPFDPTDDERDLLIFDASLGDGMAEYAGGAAMIREDCFEDYARELADDIGAIDSDAGWPCNCIDWKQAASQLAMDYSLVTFLGYDYYVRS